MQVSCEQPSILFGSFRSSRGFSLPRGTYVNRLKNLGKSACFDIKPNKPVDLLKDLASLGQENYTRVISLKQNQCYC